MKKLVSFGVIAMLTSAGFAAPSHITRDSKGGYNVTYDYNDKAKSGWYAAARAELSFLNWEYKFTQDFVDGKPSRSDTESYSFEPVFGGSLSFGKRINYFWRAELEAGFLGYHEKDDFGTKYSMSLPYAMLNGYYDFDSGLYLGAGVGIALPIFTASAYQPTTGSGLNMAEETSTSVSPMGGLMVGYSHKLDDNLVLDLRYRLAGIMGFKHTQSGYEGEDNDFNFETKTDFILDNSVSVGLRYEF